MFNKSFVAAESQIIDNAEAVAAPEMAELSLDVMDLVGGGDSAVIFA